MSCRGRLADPSVADQSAEFSDRVGVTRSSGREASCARCGTPWLRYSWVS